MQAYRSPRLPIMYVVLFCFPKLYFEWWKSEAADNNAKWWETKYAPVVQLKLCSWHRAGLGLRNRWSVLTACQPWSPRNRVFSFAKHLSLGGWGRGKESVFSKLWTLWLLLKDAINISITEVIPNRSKAHTIQSACSSVEEEAAHMRRASASTFCATLLCPGHVHRYVSAEIYFFFFKDQIFSQWDSSLPCSACCTYMKKGSGAWLGSALFFWSHSCFLRAWIRCPRGSFIKTCLLQPWQPSAAALFLSANSLFQCLYFTGISTGAVGSVLWWDNLLEAPQIHKHWQTRTLMFSPSEPPCIWIKLKTFLPS